MEFLCNEIKDKVCVKYDSEEIQDITKAVDILMNRFVDELKIKYPDIKIGKLLLCGSMAEKTRVNSCHCLEFDYLAVLKSWPGCGDFVFEHCPKGQMEVKYKRDARQSVSDEYVDLDPELKVTFTSILDKCIHVECERNLCALRLSNEHDQYVRNIKGCQFCSINMKTGKLSYIINTFPTSEIKKYKFVWTSKCKSVEKWYVLAEMEDILTQNVITFPNASDLNKYGSFFPDQSHWNISNDLTVEVEVDFHPTVELDVTKVHWNHPMMHLKTNYMNIVDVVLPNSNHYVPRTILRYLNNLSKGQTLMYFLVELLLTTHGLVFAKAPVLRKNKKYLLFPKRLHENHSSWRISTSQTELDIFHDTSEEHRLAYCVLKYLISVLSVRNVIGSFRILPRIWHYEAKIAVIKHIKSCKTPRIGTHVCLLNIMHDVALCRDAGAMDHPILHLNLYETLPPKHYSDYDYDKAIEVISFKALLLIIVYQRLEYTLTDFMNDKFSLNFIWEMKGLEPVRDHYQHRPTKINVTREALCEIKKLLQNRKKLSARNVLLKMILSQLRENRLQNFQEKVIRNNLKDLAVVDELYMKFGKVEYLYMDGYTSANLRKNYFIQ